MPDSKIPASAHKCLLGSLATLSLSRRVVVIIGRPIAGQPTQGARSSVEFGRAKERKKKK